MKQTPIIAAIAAASLCMLVACKSSQEVVPAETVTPARRLPPKMQQAASLVLLIMYDGNVGSEPLVKAVGGYGAEIIYRYDNINGMAVQIPDGKDMLDAMKYFREVEGVLSVSIDRPVRVL